MFDFKLKFDGSELLKDLRRLDQVKAMKDVTNITHTQYPGTHCPLMGAILVTRGIQDSYAFVVGTDECVYYSKSLTMDFDIEGEIGGRCFAVRLDSSDVTFGSVEKVEEAFDELFAEKSPSCIFLISTCVIEIIGDDFDALAKKLSKKHNVPVLPIHTEHFKCEDHLPGVERALTACAEMMEKQECNGSVNVLGHRLGDFTQSEVYRVLQDEKIAINIQMPRPCSLAEIKNATKAKLNIVVNRTALPLAEAMETKFGVPYIIFDKFASYESNYQAYKALFEKLEHPMPEDLVQHYEDLKVRFNAITDEYAGLSYIYGGSPFTPFEHNRLLVEYGLIPLLIQMGDVSERHYDDIDAITAKHNPYVARSANLSGLMQVYDTLKPDLNFGAGFMHVLAEKKIVPVRFDRLSQNMFGFELSELFLSSLKNAKEDVQKIREEEPSISKKDTTKKIDTIQKIKENV